tara:strand:- start:283 stop:906 length:624 start_codon:yes stop_codon:yes gene_type:complete
MKKKISIINHEQGNQLHIIRACKNIGFEVDIVNSEKDLSKSDKLILPGVGRFGTAMKNLKKKKLDVPLKKILNNNVPILGICLGFQLLFETSMEDENVKGLEILKGKFLKFPNDKFNKIPQIQWNKVNASNSSVLLNNIENENFFYFNHTYYLDKLSTNEENIKANTIYNGNNYPSVIENGNIFGTQFHPEKSGSKGLSILINFKNF